MLVFPSTVSALFARLCLFNRIICAKSSCFSEGNHLVASVLVIFNYLCFSLNRVDQELNGKQEPANSEQ